MWLKAASTMASLLFIGACSISPPRAPGAMDELWQDQAFDHDPALVSVTEGSLFALDTDLVRSLRDSPVAIDGNVAARTSHLLTLIFGPDMKAFAYAGGHSTLAAETWRAKRGDCLSLSIMSVALARALELPVQMQEVRVPASFDRRGGVDFLNNHVNVLIRNDRALRVVGRSLPAGDVVIDFEPQVGSLQKGFALSDRSILARYFNNIAAEHLANGRNRLAYAHFKAAILADPGYAPSYSNLAELYLQTGLTQGAERLLLNALALNGQSDLALGALHKLLLSQGRTGEAQRYQALLESRRDQDPYYWLGLGLERLNQDQTARAIDALERAQSLATGFDEVHRYLAIAYWRAGKLHKARDQLAVLSALDQGDPIVAKLNRKFKAETPQTQ